MSGFTYLCLLTVPLWCTLVVLYNNKKPAPIQSRTSYVKVILKCVRTRKHHWLGKLHQQETEFIILVQMKNGVIREFEVCELQYCTLKEGLTGLLVWSENRFICFEEF